MTIEIIGIADCPRDDKCQCYKCRRVLDKSEFYRSRISVRLCKICCDMYGMKTMFSNITVRINRANNKIEQTGGKTWFNPMEELKQLIDTHG